GPRQAGRIERHRRDRASRRCPPRPEAVLAARFFSRKPRRDRNVPVNDEFPLYDARRVAARARSANSRGRRTIFDQGPRSSRSVLLDCRRRLARLHGPQQLERGLRPMTAAGEASQPAALKIGAHPNAAYRMSCREIWGGNTSVETSVALPGLAGWVHSKPVE